MIRLGLALVSAALVVSACGTSDSEGEPAESKPTELANVSLADTCPKIQTALDDSFAGEDVVYGEGEYQRFADEIALLVSQVNPKGETILGELVQASKNSVMIRKIGASQDLIVDTDTEWTDTMNRVSDVCEDLGAPLA